MRAKPEWRLSVRAILQGRQGRARQLGGILEFAAEYVLTGQVRGEESPPGCGISGQDGSNVRATGIQRVVNTEAPLVRKHLAERHRRANEPEAMAIRLKLCGSGAQTRQLIATRVDVGSIAGEDEVLRTRHATNPRVGCNDQDPHPCPSQVARTGKPVVASADDGDVAASHDAPSFPTIVSPATGLCQGDQSRS